MGSNQFDFQFGRSKLSVSCLYQKFHSSFEKILKFLFIENKRKKSNFYEINYRTEINAIKEYWKNTILSVINRTNISLRKEKRQSRLRHSFR